MRLAHTVAPVQFDLAAIRAEVEAEHARQQSELVTVHTPRLQGVSESSYAQPAAPWHWLDRELSSNVAGETGAVCIYHGAAAALRLRGNASAKTLSFVAEHEATEQAHLDLFAELLPAHKHTRLLPIWRIAGFSLGFAPALVSDRALFVTVEAVETFVEEHYHEQIHPLREHGRCPELLALLEHCCADEVHHKDDACERAGGASSRTLVEQAWMRVVRAGQRRRRGGGQACLACMLL